MRKAHQEYINNLFDFQSEDNINNVSNNDKPSTTKRRWQYVKAKRKDSIGIPILKSNGVYITDPIEGRGAKYTLHQGFYQ